MTQRIAMIIPMALAALSLSGCPIVIPPIPFDANGTYTGTWEGIVEESGEEVSACAFTLELVQDTEARFPANYRVSGSVTINFTCPSLIDAVPDLPVDAVLTVNITGFLTEDGQVLVGGARLNRGVNVLVGISGEGVDADEDGALDSVSGEWVMVLEIGEFGNEVAIDGTFEAASV